jgi:type I restriction enzyme S subunit
VTNITDEGISFSNFEKFISEKEYLSGYRHFTVAKGDLLLSSSGHSWGKVASYDADEPVILNTSTIRVNEGADGKIALSLLRWILLSEGTREQLRLAMTGSCQPNFGPSHLAKLQMVVGPPDEQKLIAKFLDGVTTSISRSKSSIQNEIDKLIELRSTLIANAVTGRIKV